MAPNLTFSLAEVLAIAKIHPFYSNAQYPPDDRTVRAVREEVALASGKSDLELKDQLLLRKKDLYNVIERLVNDIRPENTYRHNVYTSISGGGGTLSRPLFFATDALENRRHRAYFGRFLQITGLIERGDWVLTTHCAGNLYRSLDLTSEIMENAGASVLTAGNYMAPEKVVQLLQDYHVNVLTGDGSQVVQIVHYISTLGTAKNKINLNKIIYTSEALTTTQKAYVHEVLGAVKIFSILGSAEAGPYGASNPDLTENDPASPYADFIIDARMTLMEVLPLSSAESGRVPSILSEGETGVIAQTSLTRLRNPVVRYLTGDVGSLRPLPERAQKIIPQADLPYLKILRLHGRDSRFSFPWDGQYIEFEGLKAVMSESGLGILQWQAILDKMEPSKEALLEIRLLCSQLVENSQCAVDRIRDFLCVDSSNDHRLEITFVKDMMGFELSQTGRKVIRFIDRLS